MFSKALVAFTASLALLPAVQASNSVTVTYYYNGFNSQEDLITDTCQEMTFQDSPPLRMSTTGSSIAVYHDLQCQTQPFMQGKDLSLGGDAKPIGAIRCFS